MSSVVGRRSFGDRRLSVRDDRRTAAAADSRSQPRWKTGPGPAHRLAIRLSSISEKKSQTVVVCFRFYRPRFADDGVRGVFDRISFFRWNLHVPGYLRVSRLTRSVFRELLGGFFIWLFSPLASRFCFWILEAVSNPHVCLIRFSPSDSFQEPSARVGKSFSDI